MPGRLGLCRRGHHRRPGRGPRGLIGAAIVLLARAVAVRDRLIAVPAAAGLCAIGGAFAAGEIFVRNGEQGASFAMAILTWVALLRYVSTLALASAAHSEVARTLPRPAIAARPRSDAANPAAARPASPERDRWPRHGRPAAPLPESPASWFVGE